MTIQPTKYFNGTPSQEWLEKYWSRYASCPLCKAAPGDPCINMKSYPRYVEYIFRAHKEREVLLQVEILEKDAAFLKKSLSWAKQLSSSDSNRDRKKNI